MPGDGEDRYVPYHPHGCQGPRFLNKLSNVIHSTVIGSNIVADECMYHTMSKHKSFFVYE